MTPACIAAANAAPRPTVSLRPGRIFTVLILALLVFDGLAKLINVPALAPIATLLELATTVVTHARA